jgi:hypothetical protein
LAVGLWSAAARGQGAADAGHVAGLNALDPAERIEAARALGQARSVAAVGPLARVLRSDPSPEVRGWTARSLAAIGSADARAALASAAQRDGDERVRGLCVQLLGQVASSPFEAASPGLAPAYEGGVYAGAPLAFRRAPRRTGVGFLVAGWSTFGLTYLVALIGGSAAYAANSDDARTWPLFLPAVGPVIQAAFVFSDDDDELGWDPTPNVFGVLAIVDALGQIAGITLAAVGHVRRARHRAATTAPAAGADPEGVDAEGADADAPESPTARVTRRAHIALLPTGPGDGPGLGLVGVF